MKKIVKENKVFVIIMLASLILHLIAFWYYGPTYDIGSDDVRYIESGITLYKTGVLTLYGTPTAQIMPGLPIFIAGIYAIFQNLNITVIALKIIYIFLSLGSLTYLYKTIKLFADKKAAALASMLLLSFDFIWMDNLIMTETPFIFFLMMMIYYSFKLLEEKKVKDLIFLTMAFILALYLRPIVVAYPFFFLGYLLFKKINFKKILLWESIIVISTIIFLLPWQVRNYKLYNEVILLTNGAGNPMYLGTFQGYDYPAEEEMDYNKVYAQMSDEMLSYVRDGNSEKEQLINHYDQKKDALLAKERMKKWWHNNKVSFLFSYLIYKPGIMLVSSFYWEAFLKVPRIINVIIHIIELLFCFVSVILIWKDKKYIREMLFLGLFYAFILYVAAVGMAFSRYAIAIYIIRFIIDGMGLSILLRKGRK